MKKIIQIMVTFLFLINTSFANAEYNKDLANDYFIENVISFIKSPDKDDLVNIKDLTEKYCETVYLEATRRRQYTEEELKKCWNFFEMKMEQEMDYIRYMQNNRGVNPPSSINNGE